jgi:hypothetical protein
MPALQNQRWVLLLTNSEYGQANTFMALTYALARHPNVHVHFGSFADCATRIRKLRDTLTANGTLGANSAITFHDIGGPSMGQASPQFQTGSLLHPPGFFGAINSYHVLPETFWNWNGEQYMAGVDGCVRIINESRSARNCRGQSSQSGTRCVYQAQAQAPRNRSILAERYLFTRAIQIHPKLPSVRLLPPIHNLIL